MVYAIFRGCPRIWHGSVGSFGYCSVESKSVNLGSVLALGDGIVSKRPQCPVPVKPFPATLQV